VEGYSATKEVLWPDEHDLTRLQPDREQERENMTTRATFGSSWDSRALQSWKKASSSPTSLVKGVACDNRSLWLCQ
jgi:hypothetical protein